MNSLPDQISVPFGGVEVDGLTFIFYTLSQLTCHPY